MEGRQGPGQVSHAGRADDLRVDSQAWEDIGVVPAGAGPRSDLCFLKDLSGWSIKNGVKQGRAAA